MPVCEWRYPKYILYSPDVCVCGEESSSSGVLSSEDSVRCGACGVNRAVILSVNVAT